MSIGVDSDTELSVVVDNGSRSGCVDGVSYDKDGTSRYDVNELTIDRELEDKGKKSSTECSK